MAQMRVGTLARKTGLTVRTLHYYEEVGLLKPAQRTEAGHRLYGREEIERLQQITSLRHLGFSLDAIREALDRPGFSLKEVVRMHREHVRTQLADLRQLQARLDALAGFLDAVGEVPVETLIQTIEVITMHEKYYTDEQMDYLRQRRDEVGEARIQQVQQEWATLFAEMEDALQRGVDPASAEARTFVARWDALVAEFTGGNPGIAQSLGKMYQAEGPQQASRGMINPAVWEYARQIREARK